MAQGDPETVVTIRASNPSSANLSPSVQLWVTKLDQNFDESLVAVPLPRQKDKSGDNNKLTGEANTIIVDIGRVNQIISVQGMLVDESTESAFTKKNNLIDLAKNYRIVKINWGDGSTAESFLGNITKLMITHTPGLIGHGQPSGYESERNYAFQLSFIIGKDT